MPQPKITGRTRLEIVAGPDATLFDRAAHFAELAGESVSEYVRRALRDRMARDQGTIDRQLEPRRKK